MEILRKGPPVDHRQYDMECDGCKSLLRVKHTEIMYNVHSDDTAKTHNWFFVCPVCDMMNPVYFDKLHPIPVAGSML